MVTAAALADDPPPGVAIPSSPDPGDTYLIALAFHHAALLVSGDGHLLEIEGELPIYSPAEFLRLLEATP